MNELSLFSGGGGGLLGTMLLGFKHIGYVEHNEYCQKIIAQRIKDGILNKAPIFADVREFIQSGAVDEYRGFADVVTAGFPCQPFSVAGKQKGAQDERNMWPQTIEVLRRVRPRYALLENVPGLLSHKYARRIFGDLAESGFDAQWRVLSAAEVGAPHKRDRVWILCTNTNGECSKTRSESSGWKKGADISRCGKGPKILADTNGAAKGRLCERASSKFAMPFISHQDVPNTYTTGCEKQHFTAVTNESGSPARGIAEGGGAAWWSTEPDVGRVANGVAHRVDRLKALGNGQVPAVVATAWGILIP